MKIIHTSNELYEASIDVYNVSFSAGNAEKWLKDNPDVTLDDIVRHRVGDMNIRQAIYTLTSPHQQIWQIHLDSGCFQFNELWKDKMYNMIKDIGAGNAWYGIIDFIYKEKMKKIN